MKNNKDILKGQSISHGTLRTNDLIESFQEFLSACELPYMEYDEWLNGDCPDDQDQALEWHDMYLNEYLIDILNTIAPAGYYFGAHVGDGSDFGFWECEV